MHKNITSLVLIMGILSFFSLACEDTGRKKAEWTKARLAADNLDHPSAITTDGADMFYVTGGTIASLKEKTSGLWTMPLAGGRIQRLFEGHYVNENKTFMPDTFFLATDEKFVYWSSGEIWRTPKTGGEPQRIAGGSPTKYALDNAKIYWQNFIGEGMPPAPIFSVDKSGGEPKALTEPLIASGITVDRENIYWAESSGIYKMPKTGGEKTKIHQPADGQQISGLAADEMNFYFTEGNGRNALYKIAKSGGAPVKIAAEINHVYKFYVDEAHVYFVVDEGSFGTALAKAPKNGGETVKIDSGYLSGFTVGKDKIYVTDIARIYELAK